MEKQTKGVHLTGDGLSVSAVAYGQTLLLEGSSLGYQLVLFPKGNCFFVLHGFRINFRSSPSWTSMDELTDFSFWCGFLRFGRGAGRALELDWVSVDFTLQRTRQPPLLSSRDDIPAKRFRKEGGLVRNSQGLEM